MARTRVRYHFEDDSGNRPTHIKATAYVPGTDTTVPGAYDAASGGSAITWPLSASSKGYVTFYLDTAQDVEMVVTDDTNFLLHAADDRPYVSVTPDLSVAFASKKRRIVNVKTYCDAAGFDTTTGAPVVTTAVQAADDACAEGDELYFPAGKYKFGTITLKSRLIVSGDDGSQNDATGVTHLYLATGTNASMFVIPVGVVYVRFRALDMIGQQENQTSGTSHGIYIVEAATILAGDYCGVVIEESCNIRNFRTDGVFLGHNRRGLIVQNGVQLATNGRNGLTLDSSDSYVGRVSAWSNVAAGIEDRSGNNIIEGADCFHNDVGIYRSNTYGVDSRKTTITGCHVNQNQTAGVRVSARGTTIVGTQFSGNSYPTAATGSHIVVDDTALGLVSILGCIFDTEPTGESAYAPLYDIYLNGTARAIVGPNVHTGQSSLGRTNTPGQLDFDSSLVTAKGDLLAATALGTMGKLAVGSDGTELVADSTQTTGLVWKQRSRSIADVRADAQIVNSTTETTLATLAVPTTVATGDGLHALFMLDLLNNSGGALTYTFKAKLGATTMFSSAGSFSSNANRVGARIQVDLLVMAAAVQRGSFLIATSGTSGANNAQLGGAVGAGYSAATEDLSAGKNLILTVTLGGAAATADVTLHAATLEISKR